MLSADKAKKTYILLCFDIPIFAYSTEWYNVDFHLLELLWIESILVQCQPLAVSYRLVGELSGMYASDSVISHW